jgi:hypothetical protein
MLAAARQNLARWLTQLGGEEFVQCFLLPSYRRGLSWGGAVYRRRKWLSRRIGDLPPLPGADGLAVHVLVNRFRSWDALWAVYSLGHFAARPIRPVFHDDGSFDPHARRAFARLFPHGRVLGRAEADAHVGAELARRGLVRLQRLRAELIFALKLIDPIVYADGQPFLLLDGDVIFYRRPDALLDCIERGQACYMRDLVHHSSIAAEDFVARAGRLVDPPFNPGIVYVDGARLDLARFEEDLATPGFFRAAGPDIFAELTLWALELVRLRAIALPEEYAICFDHRWRQRPERHVASHFCGAIEHKMELYTVAMPYVYARLRS